MKKFFKLLMLVLFLGMFTFGTVGCPAGGGGDDPGGDNDPNIPEDTVDPNDD